jgi:hypothetical protein
MKTVRAFVKRHPVLSFYALVFAISWGGLLLVVGGPDGISATPEQVERLLLPALLATFAGPSIAGIVLTGLVHGRAGLRDLLARMTRWRVGARWYAVALLTAPLFVTATLLALSLSSPEFLPGIYTSDDKATLLLFGTAWGLIGGGLLEELGWTGFAVPTMRQRYGVLGTGLIVGVLWGAWHLLITYWVMSGSTAGGLTLASFLLMFVFFHAGSLPAYRVLMVWVYDRTESLLVAMLMHASFSASRLILNPLAIAGLALAIYDLVLAVALCAVVVAGAVARDKHLSRRSLRRRAA